MVDILLLGFDTFRGRVSLSSARTISPTSFFPLILIFGSFTTCIMQAIGHACILGISVKLQDLVFTDKAKETGSQKEIASDNGDQSVAIGCEQFRKCLDDPMLEVMDTCWEVGIPNRCYHGSYWRQPMSSAYGSEASEVCAHTCRHRSGLVEEVLCAACSSVVL